MNTTFKSERRIGAASDADGIRAVIDDLAEAHRLKDAGRMTSHFADGNVQFIMAPPLQYSSANSWDKKAVEAWFSTFDGPILCETRDLHIAASGDVAFCHYLNRFSAVSVEEGPFEMWNRVTCGLRKIGDRWMIAHVHSSVPFYMDGSFKAAVDLTP